MSDVQPQSGSAMERLSRTNWVEYACDICDTTNQLTIEQNAATGWWEFTAESHEALLHHAEGHCDVE